MITYKAEELPHQHNVFIQICIIQISDAVVMHFKWIILFPLINQTSLCKQTHISAQTPELAFYKTRKYQHVFALTR